MLGVAAHQRFAYCSSDFVMLSVLEGTRELLGPGRDEICLAVLFRVVCEVARGVEIKLLNRKLIGS